MSGAPIADPFAATTSTDADWVVIRNVGGEMGARHQRILMVAAAVFLIAWGGFGFYRGLHGGFSGGLYDPSYRVVGVFPGSLADKAGFRPGDRVISVEGIPVGELGMESRWPRSLARRIGQSHRFVVERKGERVPVDVVYPPPSRAAVNNRIGTMLTGFGFLLAGVWTFLAAGTPAALALARTGLASGVGIGLGMGPGWGSWNGVKDHIATAAPVLMLILLLRFFVTFPRPKPVRGSRLAWWIVYGAWGFLVVFMAAELIVHPALYYETGSVSGPLMLAYLALILAAITHTVVKTPRAELRESGMNLILVGVLVAVLGLAAAFIPGPSLPGWVYSLPLLAIPLTLAMAVRRQARLGPGTS